MRCCRDRAATAELHEWQFELHAQENAFQIDPQDLVEGCRRMVLQAVSAARDAGVVEGDVESAGLFLMRATRADTCASSDTSTCSVWALPPL
jgi:hypothetical protein